MYTVAKKENAFPTPYIFYRTLPFSIKKSYEVAHHSLHWGSYDNRAINRFVGICRSVGLPLYVLVYECCCSIHFHCLTFQRVQAIIQLKHLLRDQLYIAVPIRTSGLTAHIATKYRRAVGHWSVKNEVYGNIISNPHHWCNDGHIYCSPPCFGYISSGNTKSYEKKNRYDTHHNPPTKVQYWRHSGLFGCLVD